MVNEHQIRWIALFFFFALLDEKAALRASDRAVAALKVRLRGTDPDDEYQARVALMQICKGHWEKISKQTVRGKLNLSLQDGWSLPDHTDLSPWARFHKDASDEEMVALLFARILGFAESEIAVALGVTEGTVSHRLGKAVRALGAASR